MPSNLTSHLAVWDVDWRGLPPVIHPGLSGQCSLRLIGFSKLASWTPGNYVSIHTVKGVNCRSPLVWFELLHGCRAPLHQKARSRGSRSRVINERRVLADLRRGLRKMRKYCRVTGAHVVDFLIFLKKRLLVFFCLYAWMCAIIMKRRRNMIYIEFYCY